MVSIPKEELKRKGFHMLSLVYMLAYWFLNESIVIWGLAVTIAVVGLFEIVRFTIPKFNIFFVRNFKGFYRKEETRKVSGLIGTLSGALIAILLFPNKYMVMGSFLYLAFGDSIAAVAGKTFGKHKPKILKGKSLEGSLACLAACFIAGLFLFNWKFALTGAIIATIVEAIPWPINDNFWMQILNAGLLTLLSGVMIWAV